MLTVFFLPSVTWRKDNGAEVEERSSLVSYEVMVNTPSSSTELCHTCLWGVTEYKALAWLQQLKQRGGGGLSLLPAPLLFFKV